MPVLRFSLHHLKSEGDSEEWCEYDAAGNKVQEKVVQDGVVRKYDANGNKVYLCYSEHLLQSVPQ